MKRSKARRSPKRKSKRGGLDVEAEEWHGEVQKGSQSVADWTLKWRKGRKKSKKEVKAWRIGR